MEVPILPSELRLAVAVRLGSDQQTICTGRCTPKGTTLGSQANPMVFQCFSGTTDRILQSFSSIFPWVFPAPRYQSLEAEGQVTWFSRRRKRSGMPQGEGFHPRGVGALCIMHRYSMIFIGSQNVPNHYKNRRVEFSRRFCWAIVKPGVSFSP